MLLHLDFCQVVISGESNNWHLGAFRRGVFRTCGMYCLNAIGFISDSAQGPFRVSFSGKLGNPTRTVGRTALWQNYCVDNTPDTRSKPVVRRSLFLGLLYLLGIFKVPQNAIRVDTRVIFSGYSLKPERLTMNCIDSG